jgi:hypothetical protein
MNDLPPLITPHDVADWLTQPVERVLRLARAGKMPCVVLPGGDIMFDRRELAVWLTAHYRPATSSGKGASFV